MPSCLEEIEAMHKTIDEMIERSEKIIYKFKATSSQYSLLKNRIKSLEISKSLIDEYLLKKEKTNGYNKSDYDKALAPIESLLSKSEKVILKLSENSWQNKMLGRNIKVLEVVKELLLVKIKS